MREADKSIAEVLDILTKHYGMTRHELVTTKESGSSAERFR